MTYKTKEGSNHGFCLKALCKTAKILAKIQNQDLTHMKLNATHLTMTFSKPLHFEVCCPLIRFYCSGCLVIYTATLTHLCPPTALEQ